MTIDTTVALVWLQKLWPYGGALVLGGALTEIAKPFHNWRKRRTTRRHLYVELAFNYLIFCKVVKEPDSLSQYPTWRDYPVRTKYYEYALKDMDTLHDIFDYGYVSSIFDEIQLVPPLRGEALSHRLYNIKEAITNALINGTIDKSLLLKHASDAEKALVDSEIVRVMLRRKEQMKVVHPATLSE